MFDLKLTPVAQQFTTLSHAVVELQEFAVHRSDLAVTNLNIQTIADSVTTVFVFCPCGEPHTLILETKGDNNYEDDCYKTS